MNSMRVSWIMLMCFLPWACARSGVTTSNASTPTDDQSASGGATDDESSPVSDSVEAPVVALTATRLPVQGGDASCDAFAPLTACALAARSDAILLGRILRISGVATPFMMPNVPGDSTVYTDPSVCKTTFGVALGIDLRVEKVLDGSVAQSELTVWVGHEHTQLWTPSPVFGSAGNLEWLSGPNEADPPFPVGTALLAAITRSPTTGQWSLMMEPPYAADETVGVVGPSDDGCESKLEGFEGPNGLAALTSVLAACDAPSVPPNAEYTAKVAATWAQARCFPAICFDSVEPRPGSCKSVFDCKVGQTCTDSMCVQLD